VRKTQIYNIVDTVIQRVLHSFKKQIFQGTDLVIGVLDT